MAVRRINLALQGGGAHGAFTWGVLDRLLEDESIEIAAVSGTSAGALNGAALKAGLATGGRAAARENLDWLWAQIGAVGDVRLGDWFRAFLPLAGLWSGMTDRLAPFSPLDFATRVFSPYDFGPFYRNPLDRVVRRFPFDKVCEIQGAMSAWSKSGQDVNALLKSTFDMNAMDFSAAHTWWLTQLTADLSRFTEYNAKIEELWKQHPGGDSQLVAAAMDKPRKSYVLTRGDFLKPAEAVGPGVPVFLGEMQNSPAPDRQHDHRRPPNG